MAKNGSPNQAGGDLKKTEELASTDASPRTEKRGGVISRRSFLGGMAAAGAAFAFMSRSTALAQASRIRSAEVADDVMLRMYDTMCEIRWFERTNADRAIQGQGLGSTGHLYAGQEAVATGASYAMEHTDFVLSTHRAHGHGLAKGVSMNGLAAELYRRATGMGGGYGGTMHFSDPSVGFLGADGIVGPSAGFGTGVAHALKIRNQGRVALVYGGDGHYAGPHFHSALSEAVVNQLPFIYLVENNGYLQYTHRNMITTLEDYAPVARAVEMPAVVVDGQDVLAVHDAVKTAVERGRRGGGPTFIEAKTYRYYVHSGTSGAVVGELGSFGPDGLLINIANRPEREVRAWLAKDPIDIFRRTLIEFGTLDEAEAEARNQAAKAKAEEAFRLAFEGPAALPEDGLKNVFANRISERWNVVS